MEDTKSPSLDSEFGFDKIIIKECHITRQPVDQQFEFTISLDPSGTVDYIKSEYILELILNVTDEKNSFNASITAFAVFTFPKGIPAKKLMNYFYINAPAIVFPYLRGYLSSLTALSGLRAINLPVRNLSGLKEQLEANTIVIGTPTHTD